MGLSLALVLWVVTKILQGFGILGFLGAFLIAMGPKIPKVSGKMAGWHEKQSTRHYGGVTALVQDEDGLVSRKKAKWDAKNTGVWVRSGDGWNFYGAPEGAQSFSYAGGTVYLVYHGLGAVSDFVAGEIGRQAKIKTRFEQRSGERPTWSRLRETLLGANLPTKTEPLADGGNEIELSEFTATLPKRAVVDLRNTITNAPFNVSPMAFDRVEKNAQAGAVGLGRFGALGQTGMILGAVVITMIMTWFIISHGGGGGGGGGIMNSLPLTVGWI